MMRKMKLIASRFICAVCAVLLTPLVSYANDASRNQEIVERFAKCDVNKDGKLTLDEAKGCMPRIYSNFSYIDSGNKGYVTVAEIQAIADR
jgi:Ca2+-binding EF-hand superfamily protein